MSKYAYVRIWGNFSSSAAHIEIKRELFMDVLGLCHGIKQSFYISIKALY